MGGYCVIEGVIPPGEVDAIRESMVKTLVSIDDKNASSESMDKGAILKYDQSIAPYLADRKIMDVAEAIFGPHVRADAGAIVVRHPTPDRASQDIRHGASPDRNLANTLNAGRALGHDNSPISFGCVEGRSQGIGPAPFRQVNGS